MRSLLFWIALIFPVASMAQDTIRLEPASTLPVSNLFRVDANRIIASAKILDGDYEYDNLIVIDVSDPYHPYITANVLPITTRLLWDPIHYRPDEYHADALLIDSVMISAINRTLGAGDVPPVYNRIGPLTLEAESLDHTVKWSVTILDSMGEEAEEPSDFPPHLMPGRLLYMNEVLYWAAGDWGLRLYDLSDRNHPVEIDTFGFRTREMARLGSKLIIYEDSDIVALDLSDPRSPSEIWRRTQGTEEFPYSHPVNVGDSLFMVHIPLEPNRLDFIVMRFMDEVEPEIIGEFQLTDSTLYRRYLINSDKLFLIRDDGLTVYEMGEDFSLNLFGRFTFSRIPDYFDPYGRIYPFGRMVFIFNPANYGWNAMPEGFLYDIDQNGVDYMSDLFPRSMALSSFPNPFNSTTTISYTLPRAGHYTLTITDITGREVARLAEGWKEAGSYREVWNGDHTPAGIYELRITGFVSQSTQKLVLVK